jgi:GNAT superfamily N-acetyltransferase
MSGFHIRLMEPKDRHEVAELIYVSINHWYMTHGQPAIFSGGPATTDVFYDVYAALDPGCGVVAVNEATQRLMGSCFYHPRPHHVSLGIMNVHPNYFGSGAGRALLQFIIDFSRDQGKPLRLTQSALNLDSFSLYNKAGFVPRYAYQDMMLAVPESGWNRPVDGIDHVRDATLDDITAMADLEMHVSGITRDVDYRYCIENTAGFWHVSVYEGNRSRSLEGFMISCSHPAMNMLGPCVARDQQQAVALIARELDLHRGRTPVFLVPMECQHMVQTMYDWGAKNCELHFCQVLGEFQPFRGVNMPTFLPESA